MNIRLFLALINAQLVNIRGLLILKAFLFDELAPGLCKSTKDLW